MTKLYMCQSGEVKELEIEKETAKQFKIKNCLSVSILKKEELNIIKDDRYIWFYVISDDKSKAIGIYNEYLKSKIPLILDNI